MALTFTILTGAKTTEGSIKNWVNRSDVPSTTVLTEAEAFIYQTLRVREMRQDTALTIAINTNTIALPTNPLYLAPISFTPYGWSEPLRYVHEAALEDYRDEDGALFSGTPTRWAAIGTVMAVNVDCDAAFSGRLKYYGQPAALSGSNETNFMTTKYPTLLRYACLMFAYDHAKDMARSRSYLPFVLDAIEQANAVADLERAGQEFPA